MRRDEKPYAILAYCFILCIIPLVYKKNDEAIQFHARQGLALFLCEMAFFIVSIVFVCKLVCGLCGSSGGRKSNAQAFTNKHIKRFC